MHTYHTYIPYIRTYIHTVDAYNIHTINTYIHKYIHTYIHTYIQLVHLHLNLSVKPMLLQTVNFDAARKIFRESYAEEPVCICVYYIHVGV